MDDDNDGTSGLRESPHRCFGIRVLQTLRTTAIPNLHQMTRSNLTEVKKTMMQWMNHLQLETVVDYAVKRRKDVVREYREEGVRSEHRHKQKVQAKKRREAFQQRAKRER